MEVKLARGLSMLTTLAMLGACAPKAQTVSTEHTQLSFEDGPSRPELDTIAVLTPLEEETHEMWSALVLELEEDFNIVTVPVTKTTAPDHLGRELARVTPSCVIVVDNRTLGLYRRLQNMRPEHVFPPSVIVMTSFLERAIGSLRSATGIAYEVPAVSSVVALREVSEKKVERVGVVHRRTFSRVVEAQLRLAAVEKVQLIPIVLPDDPQPEEVEDSLDLLVVKHKVDALWVLNDNRLLRPDLLMSSWLPVLQFRPIPVIVGVSALVNPDVHFGTLAVIPHHKRLGVQAANLVFDLSDNDWRLEEANRVELPLSVTMVVDVAQVSDFFGLKPDALAKIDEAVE